jgi:putative sigma-54 modulation protein
LSNEVRDYVEKKMDRVVRHFDGLHDAEVVLSADGGKWTAEVIVGAVRGQRYVAEGSETDVFVAVDIAMDKIDRQVRKLKGKLRERYGKGPEAKRE